MSDYEKLTRKADGLTVAAHKCKSLEGRACLVRFAGVIIAIRDAMTVEEVVA